MTTQLKVVCATYYPPDSVFKIPKTIDIEDKSVVKGYWVKYDTLYIEFVDTSKETLSIEPHYAACESSDYKSPNTIVVGDAADYGIDDDEEEEEEEEEKKDEVLDYFKSLEQAGKATMLSEEEWNKRHTNLLMEEEDDADSDHSC